MLLPSGSPPLPAPSQTRYGVWRLVRRPRIDSRITFTHRRTSPTVAPTTTTASGAKNAICSSEYFVTQVPSCRDPECPECLKLTFVGCTTTDQIGSTAGPPDLRGYGRTASAEDRPFYGSLQMRGGVGSDVDYVSGEDYVVEFLGYRFGFNARDFQERVTAAAVRLGLIESNALDEEETEDLVELAADGRIVEARSGLGQYLVRHWERVALVDGESLVYWLRKLVFRGAWLDHRVKEGLLEVSWDEDSGDFGYAEPRGGRSLLELAPVPSWHALQFRR